MRLSRYNGFVQRAMDPAGIIAAMLIAAQVGFAATFTVTTLNTNDPGGLHDAMASANSNPGPDEIVFQTGLTGTVMLGTLDFLFIPTIDDGTGGVTIRGDHRIRIAWATTIGKSSKGTSPDGFTIVSADNIIENFEIEAQQGAGIEITGLGGTNNIVRGCTIGTSATDNATFPGNDVGVQISFGASGNIIGGTTAADRNIISENLSAGVHIVSANNNTVIGNYIGTTSDGAGDLGNGIDGVLVSGTSADNVFGGTTAASGNVISGNGGQGILNSGTGATGTIVQGNYIGLNAAGTAAVANAGDGVRLSGVDGAEIGRLATGTRNVISGNTGNGIQLVGSLNVFVARNMVGTNANGNAPVGNGLAGIVVTGTNSNLTIGAAGAGNVFSGNASSGILMSGVVDTGVSIQGNLVGTDRLGDSTVPNGGHGVRLQPPAASVEIGGTGAGDGNTVSGNAGDGISISASNSNLVEGNFIGVNTAGTASLANGGSAISVTAGGAFNQIGGSASGARNVIAGGPGALSPHIGLLIDNSPSNVVQGNYIGTNAAGDAAIGTSGQGVFINGSGSIGNTIGGSLAGEGNVISGNGLDGVTILGGASGNSIQGNVIGLAADGDAALGNGANGILIDGAGSTLIGGLVPEARNVISANGEYGIQLANPATDSTEIKGNYIGLDATGASDRGNTLAGILAFDTTDTSIGSGEAGGGNVVSGNGGDGIVVDGPQTTAPIIKGNYIGVDANGAAAVANSLAGLAVKGGASGFTIGGVLDAERNVISGNT
ncbi:MAG: right-handed parallel beta-helix repeat-containing protein, partial [Candidatus Hydrogenedentota bacterium]